MNPSASKKVRAAGPASIRGTAPTFAEMDMPLSFRTTTIGSALAPALFSPSKVSPPVSAPSPTIATARPDTPVRARACAIPSATLTAVQACPAGKTSKGLSRRIEERRDPALLAQACASAGTGR